jgi:hypothetical protein
MTELFWLGNTSQIIQIEWEHKVPEIAKKANVMLYRSEIHPPSLNIREGVFCLSAKILTKFGLQNIYRSGNGCE